MIPDRTTLLLACAIAAANLFDPPAALQQVLAVIYFVHTLRAFPLTAVRTAS